MVKSLLFDLEKGTGPVLELLRSDEVIQTVEYIRVEYWGDGNVLVSDDELIVIFGIIGSLPRIRELRIEFDELPLPAQALRNAMAHPYSRIRYIALEDVRLSGSLADFEDVADAVRRSASLKTFRMYRCGPSPETRATLDPIITALSDIPTLKDVTLSTTHLSPEALGALGRSKSLETVSLDHMTISALPLAELCQSQSIKDLKFWGMPEINDDISSMESALAINNSLKMLRVRYCHLNQNSGVHIARMIAANKTLESITLENMNWRNFGGPIQKALEMNNTLRSLSLSIDSKDLQNISNDAQQIALGLEVNIGLQRLRLLFRDVSLNDIQKAFLGPITGMLRKNYTLESLYLNNGTLALSPEVDFLLKLNRTGKRHLLYKHAPNGELMDMLAAYSGDPSITHYALTMNPALFHV
ncbi:Inherit from KOG: leucine rich repeat containing [Seminavis robusta]|uniref:Inherit from KOG: leucine rich repeat containing n=1 Tax=Seminavis robusta TaxID=568900 RepID=A0A9N8H1I0_9STRA|nr:Inherit from KOG: leucine rich repeat containing [Seminavis robusta]|eukprot:Sro41_g025220.1 Inherit from KOG: leucine rich repeat containing (415) ;mRNA; f:85097-86341